MSELPRTRPSLMVRLRDPRDGRAWEEFVEIYEPLIYRLARGRGLQDADAAELAQEVFAAVSSAIERWNPDRRQGKFRNWLFTVARNLMIDRLRTHRRHTQGSGKTAVRRALEQQPAPGAPEEAELFELEYQRQVFRWAAERIRDEFRENTWKAFWLTAVDGQNPKDVARRLGLTVGAVYKCRSRVMGRLRETVERLEET